MLTPRVLDLLLIPEVIDDDVAMVVATYLGDPAGGHVALGAGYRLDPAAAVVSLKLVA